MDRLLKALDAKSGNLLGRFRARIFPSAPSAAESCLPFLSETPANRNRQRIEGFAMSATRIFLLSFAGLVSATGLARAEPEALRVCADPNNMPFSDAGLFNSLD